MEISFIVARLAWTSTYTYILLFFVAAFFLAYVGRPRGKGEAVKRLFAGSLIGFDKIEAEKLNIASDPTIHVHCEGGGKVRFDRLCIEGLTSSGAVSLAVTFKGKDVEIKERVSEGYPSDEKMAGASFIIDMTGHEWRHIQWVNEETGQWCAFGLHVREGIDFLVALKR